MLAKTNRLTLSRDFKEISKKGKRLSSPLLNFAWRKNDLLRPRFAFVVSLKISKKAVVRNRIKRQSREIVRLLIKNGKITAGVDGVFYTKTPIITATYIDMEKTIFGLLRKSMIL